MDHLEVILPETSPIPTIDRGGEEAAAIFGPRWAVVRGMLALVADREMNRNASYSDDFPDIEKMTGQVRIDSIEFASDPSGAPVAFYMLRCIGKGGGDYMTIEVKMVAHDRETPSISETTVSAQ